MKIKICKKCNKEKSLQDFPKHSQTKDGYLGHCKNCQLKVRQTLRHSVTDIKKKCIRCNQVKGADEFAKNPRLIGGLHNICKNCSNSERRDKKYHEVSGENRKKRKEEDLNYKEYLNRQKRENSRKNFKTQMLANCKRRALKKGLEFSICKEDIIIPKICPILKVPFILGTGKNYEYTPTIDRINNYKGYTKENIQIITKKANSMKNSASFKELKLFAEWILQNIN